MEIKEEIWKFPIENIYDTKNDNTDNDIEINKFLDDTSTKLELIRTNFE